MIRWFLRSFVARLGVVAALALVATCAHAAFTPSGGYTVPPGYTQAGCVPGSQIGSSAATSCCVARYGTGYVFRTSWSNSTGGACQASSSSQYSDIFYRVGDVWGRATACPPNSVLVSGSCVCSSGYQESTQADGHRVCVVSNNDCTAGPSNWVGGTIETDSSGAMCFHGCAIQATGTICVTYGGTTSCASSQETARFTGASCVSGAGGLPGVADANPTAPPPVTPDGPPDSTIGQCGVGRCMGSVNGTSVCVACTWTAPSTTTTTTSNGTAPGGASTSSSTTCSGSTCTTSTTGANGGVSTVTQGQAAYCASNPTSPFCLPQGGGSCTPEQSALGQCGSGSAGSFGGSCAAGFQCVGDAVQCAVAREQHTRNCVLFDVPTSLSDVGVLAASGQKHPTGHPYLDPDNRDLDLSSRIDDSPAFGGSGGCPSDVSVSVAFLGAVSLPFSQTCAYLQPLSVALRGLAFLAAAFIVFGFRSSSNGG